MWTYAFSPPGTACTCASARRGGFSTPLRWYEDNKSDPEMAGSTLGVKLIAAQAKEISFRETFGTNNLLVCF